MNIRIYLSIIILLVSINAAAAQTTAFLYQGKLTDGSDLANGNYDFEFRLFDALSGGTQQGATVQLLNVSVSNGSFSVQLDFGNQFTGAARFLDIGVKTAGDRTFTLLSPRRQITSNPYAIKSLNAASADGLSVACVNCVTSSQIQSVNGSAVTGVIPVESMPAGSTNYVQNTTSQQAASNFNISGDGTAGGTLSANAITSATQFNIGVSRVLALGQVAGIFAGRLAGTSNTTGSGNSFFGDSAGRFNTTASNNSFFGRDAGTLNTASDNSFFGAFAGDSNTTGARNAFFGVSSGDANQTGTDNSFFGYRAGRVNTASFNSFFGSGTGDSTTTGANNTFVGYNAGTGNLTGSGNSFFGSGAGQVNTGDGNSFFGYHAGMANGLGGQNTFIGYEAGLASTAYNNSFFGHRAGIQNSTGNSNTILGSFAGTSTTTGTHNVFIGSDTGQTNSTGTYNTAIGAGADVFGSNLTFATAIGAGATVATSNTIQIGRPSGDSVKMGNLFVNGIVEVGSGTYLGYTEISGSLRLNNTSGSESSQNLCVEDFGRLVIVCGSSLRFKTDVETFTGGLEILRRLRPITFNWKTNGVRDIGFAAEEVEKVEPLLATYINGQIQGVKYGQITTVLVNAVKEQQRQIEGQRQQLRDREQQAAQHQQQLQRQQQELAVLKQWYCRTHPKVTLCQATKATKR